MHCVFGHVDGLRKSHGQGDIQTRAWLGDSRRQQCIKFLIPPSLAPFPFHAATTHAFTPNPSIPPFHPLKMHVFTRLYKGFLEDHPHPIVIFATEKMAWTEFWEDKYRGNPDCRHGISQPFGAAAKRDALFNPLRNQLPKGYPLRIEWVNVSYPDQVVGDIKWMERRNGCARRRQVGPGRGSIGSACMKRIKLTSTSSSKTKARETYKMLNRVRRIFVHVSVVCTRSRRTSRRSQPKHFIQSLSRCKQI